MFDLVERDVRVGCGELPGDDLTALGQILRKLQRSVVLQEVRMHSVDESENVVDDLDPCSLRGALHPNSISYSQAGVSVPDVLPLQQQRIVPLMLIEVSASKVDKQDVSCVMRGIGARSHERTLDPLGLCGRLDQRCQLRKRSAVALVRRCVG